MLFAERRMYERGLITWIRGQSCKDLNHNKGGAGATPLAVRTCGGSAWFTGGPTEEGLQRKKKKKKKLSACRGEGSVVGPLLAVLRCRCAALLVLVLMSTLAMPSCGAQGAPTV